MNMFEEAQCLREGFSQPVPKDQCQHTPGGQLRCCLGNVLWEHRAVQDNDIKSGITGPVRDTVSHSPMKDVVVRSQVLGTGVDPVNWSRYEMPQQFLNQNSCSIA